MKIPRRRRASVAAISHAQSAASFDKTLARWNALSPFEKRVTLHKMGLPRSFYKYRSIPGPSDETGRKRLEDLVLNNGLWMADVATFNDPFEGQAAYDIPYKGAELRRKWEQKYCELGFTSVDAKAMVRSDDVAHPERLIARAQEALRRTQSHMGMCALSANPTSPLLWAHYADSHKGICVQLSPRADLHALLAHPIEYNENYPVLSDILEPAVTRGVLPMLRKSPDWSYEEEWRLVSEGQVNYLQVVAPSAISAVILGMRISDADRAYVLGLMDQREKRYRVRPIVYQAERHPRRYRIQLKRHP